MRGVETEIETLKVSSVDIGSLTAYPKRNEAILAVLRSSRGSLTPFEVSSLPIAGHRSNDDLKSVATTMSYLNQQGQIRKVGDGHNFAV